MAKRQLVVGIFFILALWAPANRRLTGATVNLAWDPSLDPVAGYFIWCVATSYGQTNVVDAGNTTNATIASLLSGEVYQFYATAYDNQGAESDPSNVVTWSGASNAPPTLGSIPAQTVEEGRTISFTATATDPNEPPEMLRFSLGAGAPTNAAIDAVTGSFSWRPTSSQAPSTNQVPIVVKDNGSPQLSDTKNAQINVLKIYTVNFGSYSGGTVTISPSTPKWPEGYRFVAGSTVQLTAQPNPGALFLGWDIDGQRVKTNPLTITMNRNYVITPRFSGGSPTG